MKLRAFARRVLVAGLLAPVLVVLGASPAAAHGVGGPRPTDYETVVRGVVPRTAGLEVRAVDLGARLELTNTTAREVVVLGYEGEPYLRVGPRGVFENVRSPAVFLNRTSTPSSPAPRTYDAKSAPRWERVSRGHTVRWHDHRAHWMGNEAPAAVRADRGRSHVVIRDFRVPLEQDGRRLDIRGDVRWVPGPSPWPWLAVAVALAAAVAVAARTREWGAVLAVALVLIVAAEAVHVIGAWGATTSGAGSKLAQTVWSFVGIALGVVSLVWIARRNAWSAAPVVLVAGVFLALAGGLADITSLTRSQIPTTLSAGIARATVAVVLGLGAGIVIGAASHLRLPRGAPAAARLPGSVAR